MCREAGTVSPHAQPELPERWLIKCTLCPRTMSERAPEYREHNAAARAESIALFGPGDSSQEFRDVCGECLSKVVLWLLDNRPDLISAEFTPPAPSLADLLKASLKGSKTAG
jgi:hypothetical protein